MQKFDMIKPRDEWKKSTLPMALTEQMRMEEVWNSLRTSENYSISAIEQIDESDDDDDDIRIVCISDTHGRHADMNIPAGGGLSGESVVQRRGHQLHAGGEAEEDQEQCGGGGAWST